MLPGMEPDAVFGSRAILLCFIAECLGGSCKSLLVITEVVMAALMVITGGYRMERKNTAPLSQLTKGKQRCQSHRYVIENTT